MGYLPYISMTVVGPAMSTRPAAAGVHAEAAAGGAKGYGIDFTVLFAKNVDVDAINNAKLRDLKGEPVRCDLYLLLCDFLDDCTVHLSL